MRTQEDAGAEDAGGRELWERARTRDPAARDDLAELASRVGLAELERRGAPRGDLEDLAQEIVRSTLAYVERGGPSPKDLRAFLKYRAWGVLSDFRKRLRARPMHHDEDGMRDRADPGQGPQAGAERRQVLAALADCRSHLAPEQRETIEMRYLEGRDGAEIAERLGVHRNTVHVRVHRALIALRECLERKGVDVEDARP